MLGGYLPRFLGWLESTGLQFRLFILVVVALIPTLGIVLYSASDQRHRAWVDAQDNALRLARLEAADQEKLIIGARSLLITLAQLPDIYMVNADACNQLRAKLLPQYPPYINFGAIDVSGNMYCPGLALPNLINMADRPYFQMAMQTRDFAVGEYVIGRVHSTPVFTFGYPVFDPSGNPRGIVIAGLNLDWLAQSIAAVSLPQDSDLWILDRNGATLAQYPEPYRWQGHKMPVAAVLNTLVGKREGVVEADDTTGTSRLYAFTTVHIGAQPDMYVVIGIPRNVAFAESDAILINYLVVLISGALAELAMTGLTAKWFIMQPVDALLAATKQLSRGNLRARANKVASVGELRELAADFNEMAQALERRDLEQQQAQEQIRRHTLRAETLARIVSRLNAQLDPKAVFDILCEETARSLHAPVSSVFPYDKPNNSFSLGGAYGLLPGNPEQMCTIPQALVARHASTHETVFAIDDLTTTPGWQARCQALHVQSLLAAAIEREGELVGYLVLFATGLHCWSEDERILLKGIAEEAALAIANARLFGALQQEQRERANLLRQIITAQEDERMRIARELHDETGQSLTGLMLGLDVVHLSLPKNSHEAYARIDEVRSIAENMQANLRRLVADLRPSLLDDLGLASAIAWYGEQRLNPLGITLELNADSTEVRLPREIETALFRIVQEAVTNVVRHADATGVHVRLAREDGKFMLQVVDNGQGFDPQALEGSDGQGKHLGLSGMRERVALLGGKFDLQTAPGRGTAIRVSLRVAGGELK